MCRFRISLLENSQEVLSVWKFPCRCWLSSGTGGDHAYDGERRDGDGDTEREAGPKWGSAGVRWGAGRLESCWATGGPGRVLGDRTLIVPKSALSLAHIAGPGRGGGEVGNPQAVALAVRGLGQGQLGAGVGPLAPGEDAHQS